MHRFTAILKWDSKVSIFCTI